MLAAREQRFGFLLHLDGVVDPEFASAKIPGKDAAKLAPPEERSGPHGIAQEHCLRRRCARAPEQQIGEKVSIWNDHGRPTVFARRSRASVTGGRASLARR